MLLQNVHSTCYLVTTMMKIMMTTMREVHIQFAIRYISCYEEEIIQM